ncbi:Arc family DNA-binding protein [Mesorhizobium sp. M7A.F.Ca.US.008.03.1.1]|uniref:Arc family DNA-binding protein n=1 Tax=Mesorhizobium sp. M7A.F.Ca.US.008.03.1.1 TaxID=2496742 RepID=UPI000FCB0238|nr:Arc family DNA-binding protein [Mesorhizobium sp. M7A.F.Ca.US.008.03.1.1]RUW61835.1 Arc family DNA-binding protein [Mesorhizobium sp. M7A.F.Ca.US.008.03.1.1]
MAREDLHFRLRIPEDLKARIENAAAMNDRSMTAEIIARLQWTFGPSDDEMGELADQVNAAEEAARDAQRTISELSHSLRTREQEIDSLKVTLEKASAHDDGRQPDDEPIFNIVLDAKGRPISWPEIAAHIHRTAKAAGLETVGFRAAIFNAEKQDDEKFFGEYARLVRWYQDQTRKHVDVIREG